MNRLLVNGSSNVTTNVKLETRGSDDHVARNTFAVLEDDLVTGHLVNVTGGNVCLTLAQVW